MRCSAGGFNSPENGVNVYSATGAGPQTPATPQSNANPGQTSRGNKSSLVIVLLVIVIVIAFKLIFGSYYSSNDYLNPTTESALAAAYQNIDTTSGH